MKLLILLVVGYLCYRMLKNWMMAGGQPREHVSTNPREQIDDVMIQDPACGVYFSKENAVRAQINGQELFFCSPECKDKYLNQQDEA
jgi:YHS domain-containing protein